MLYLLICSYLWAFKFSGSAELSMIFYNLGKRTVFDKITGSHISFKQLPHALITSYLIYEDWMPFSAL